MPIQTKLRGNHGIGRRRSPGLASCLIAACALTPLASAAENPGAHEHGSARLQMALENNRIDLMFTSPAYNLAGFERDARTEDEKNRLTEINRWLEINPLINTAAGTCKVASANVESGNAKAPHGNHDHHHDDHDHGHQHHDEATHRDYEVTQQLECTGDAIGEVLTSPLLARYPELQELTIEWVSASGQGSARMTSSNETFTAGQ